MAPWVAAGALLLTLALAYAGKAVCIDGEPGFWGVTRYCYSDIRVLWSFRGFDVDAVPYAGAPADYVEDYTLEYPPGMAFPAWLIALATDSRRGFFDLHAFTFVLASAATLALLDVALRHRSARAPPGRRPSRWRLLGFALSPALLLFGMQNWDLWSVVLVAGGLAAAARRRPDAAAVWFGLGAAVKWWPALLVLVLVAGEWAPRDEGARLRGPVPLRGVTLRPAFIAGGVWALTQLPALVISPTGWWRALAFHLRRSANLDSAAAAVARFGRELVPGAFWDGPFSLLVTVGSLALLLVGAVIVVRRLTRGTLDPGDGALALVGLFLLTGKVFSPQFVLWLLPVAVVARTGWAPVLAVESSNAVVWLLYGPWMGNLDDDRFGGFLIASQAAALVRSAAVAWLVIAALAPARSARDEQPDDGEADRADGGDQAPLAVAHVPGEQPE